MYLAGSNDMLQSLETVGPAINNSATEGFSMPTDLICSSRLRVQALLHVHFLTALSCYQNTDSMCRVLEPCVQTPLVKSGSCVSCFFVHVNGFLL